MRARRVANAVALALLIAFAAGYSSRGLQSFAASGSAKRLALPAIFLLFAVTAVWQRRGESAPAIRLPSVWWWLMGLAATSTVSGILFPPSAMTTDALMQGLVLFGGIAVTVFLGYSSPNWLHDDQRRLLTYLIGAGLVTLVTEVRFAAFTALIVPAIFSLLAVIIFRRKVGWLGLLFAATVVLFFFRTIMSTQTPVSVALLLQILACLLILVVATAPQRLRGLLAGITIVLGMMMVWDNATEFSYLVGDSVYQDVTLAQRGYETEKVLEATGASTGGVLFGLGLGGVVDLQQAPDALTLTAAGRDLTQVDDVHLLSSYLLLKFGVAGLLWLAVFAWHLGLLARRVLARKRPELFEVALLMFAAAGIAVGIPAATNFIANPLPMLALGILAARQSAFTSRL